MKKLVSLSLVLSLALGSFTQTFTAAQTVSPSLKNALYTKYILKQPLSKHEQVVLKKASKRAIAAGLVALGLIAAGAGAKYAHKGANYPKVGMLFTLPEDNHHAVLKVIAVDPEYKLIEFVGAGTTAPSMHIIEPYKSTREGRGIRFYLSFEEWYNKARVQKRKA